MTGPNTMWLRDAIDIPERVDASRFVVNLKDAVGGDATGRAAEAKAEATIDDYVVTEAVARAFGEALGKIHGALETGRPTGAYLHGDFGSGKSHFMAVLHLLLGGGPAAIHAKSKPGLGRVVADHQDVLGATLLPLDFNLIGADSIRDALFRGYLDQVARLHPDAPPVQLHESAGLFRGARAMREAVGDGPFFQALNQGGAPAGSGWGRLAAGWDAARFDRVAAAGATPDDAERDQLVTALQATPWFSGYDRAGQWVGLVDGLSRITAHAHRLGYQGIVLLLDELVLWLSHHLGDLNFIRSETAAVGQLVDSAARYEVPVIALVARQRDLSDFVGHGATGAERQTIEDELAHWAGRFDTIRLPSSDLGEIVQARLVTPKNDEARDALATGLAKVRANGGEWDVLATGDAGQGAEAFQKVYPFSPALIDALVAVSGLAQRDRTALRALFELLVRGRAQLTCDDVIGVGELFDVVAATAGGTGGSDLAPLLVQARRFADDKFEPWLRQRYGEEWSEDRAAPCQVEDRLMKTLLVAALAPGATSLQTMTASKLAALNAGSVKTRFASREVDRVMELVKTWAGQFPEVTFGAGDDPEVKVALSGVDVEAILARVQTADTRGAREGLIKTLLAAELGLTESKSVLGGGDYQLKATWRGRATALDVVFGNVRDPEELADYVFQAGQAGGAPWRLIVDYPFDEETYTPLEDAQRVERLRDAGVAANTLIWLPHFLTAETRDSLGELVKVRELLKGSRLEENAGGLTAEERENARRTLETRQETLTSLMTGALEEAYGVVPASSHVDAGGGERRVIESLAGPGADVRPAMGQGLDAGLRVALYQAFTDEAPAHPKFEPSETEVRTGELSQLVRAAQAAVAGGGRLPGLQTPALRTLEHVVKPLTAGQLRENVYTLDQATFTPWWDLFTKAAAPAAVGDPTGAPAEAGVTVRTLRAALQDRHMAEPVEDALIELWALLADRQWYVGGQAQTEPPALGKLHAEDRLLEPDLPAPEEWAEAQRRAGRLLGAKPEPRLTAAAVGRLSGRLQAWARGALPDAKALAAALNEHGGLGLTRGSTRVGTARAAVRLLEALAREGRAVDRVRALAADRAGTGEHLDPVRVSLERAQAVVKALEAFNWEALQAAQGSPNGRAIAERLAQSANAEEMQAPLGAALDQARKSLNDLLKAAVASRPVPAPGAPEAAGQAEAGPRARSAGPGPAPTSPAPTPPAPPTAPAAARVIECGPADLDAALDELHHQVAARLKDGGGLKVRLTWQVLR